MMYTITTIFVLMSIVVYTNAAVAIYPAQEKPAEFADQDGCYLEHLHKVIPYGDYYTKGSCYKYTCYTSNMTQLVTCGVAVIDPRSPCELISDESQDFPDCCPMVMCHTIPPEASSEPSSVKTTDTPVTKQSTSEHAKETSDDQQVTENLSTNNDGEESTGVPLLKYLSTSERVNEKTTSAPASKILSVSETANEGSTAPLVERMETSDTQVPATGDAPLIYRSITDASINELLIAQASVNH